MKQSVIAEAFDPEFDEGDCSYQSIYPGSDGRIYFTVSTHRIDTHARFCCFDPAENKMVFTMDIGISADENAETTVPQGKIHVPPVEADKKLYFASHFGYYGEDLKGRKEYPGFHIFCFDMRTNELSVLVQGPDGEGLITGTLDNERLIYYGLTYPSGFFCRYDLNTDHLEISPPACFEKPEQHTVRGKQTYPVCRALALDSQGNLYGSCSDGAVWSCRPNERPAMIYELNVLQGAVGPIDRKGRERSFWRTLFWNDQNKCFYGIHEGTQSLFRFDPDRKNFKPVARIGTAEYHKKGHSPTRSQLGLTIGNDQTIYHIAHGPPVQAPGKRNILRSAYLTSYSLHSGRAVEHGPIYLANGERVLFAESLVIDPQGRLYTVAWIEVSDPSAFTHYQELRQQASNGECKGEVYRIMLLRIPTETKSE